ncbi:MAG: PAS domain S-box protein, partial [Prosthecobacter sp.]|nr:PAS domain S-box protein [Prosthecobacter sp.]
EDILPKAQVVDDFEVRHTFEHLGPRIMMLNARRLPQGTGTTPLIVLGIEDITERTEAEESLRQSEARKNAILLSAPDAIITMDHEGNFVEFNPAAEKIFGYAQADVLGRPLAEWIIPERLRERHRQGMAHYQATGLGPILNRQIEMPALRADGTEFPAELAIIPIPGSDPPLFTAFLRDITERKQAEDQLRASLKEVGDLKAAVDEHAIVAITDPQGKITYVNDKFCAISKYSREELLGQDHRIINSGFHPKEFIRDLWQTITHGQVWHGEIKNRAKDGSFYWVDTTIVPFLNDQGKPRQYVAIRADITERKQAEAALLAHAAELAQADRSKDEFLAMLAHELRNPLASMRNAAEILKIPKASADEQTQAQRILGRQIGNMTRIIDDLLDISRITEGKIELRREPVALEAIFTAAVSLARTEVAKRGQKLTVSLPAEAVFLNADTTRLEQVLGNLLGNACKYSGEGSHIALSAGRAADAEPPEVIISVRDNGIGIAPELLPRIFDLFVQGSRALDRAHGGLGIGLSLVRRIVKLHGGRVEARSQGSGQGAEFILHLPILREAPPPPPPPPAGAVSHRILIVDDNEDSARSLAVLKSRRGHETRTAFNGPDALGIAAEFQPEVVLLDIGLPGMDGFEVARQIRAIPSMKGALLIAMSGYGSAEDRAKAVQAGFDQYMVKPVDLDQLREWLKGRAVK